MTRSNIIKFSVLSLFTLICILQLLIFFKEDHDCYPPGTDVTTHSELFHKKGDSTTKSSHHNNVEEPFDVDRYKNEEEQVEQKTARNSENHTKNELKGVTPPNAEVTSTPIMVEGDDEPNVKKTKDKGSEKNVEKNLGLTNDENKEKVLTMQQTETEESYQSMGENGSQSPSQLTFSNTTAALTNNTSTPHNFPKILLYVTTHLSEDHMWFFKACWPNALQNSSILKNADVMIYFTPKSDHQREEGYTIFQETFDQQKLTVQEYPNLQYQQGAMAALINAQKERWFDGYDWVIRLNPDVIIRDESFLLDTIMNDSQATGLLIDCWQNKPAYKTPKFHTDFFMIKPSVLQEEAFLKPFSDNAEESFTHDIWDNIFLKGGARLIEGAAPRDPACRAGAGKKFHETPITHFHVTRKSSKKDFEEWSDDDVKDFRCPIPFGAYQE